MGEFFDNISKKFVKLTSKFDGISEKIKDNTGIKVNVGAIVLGAIMFIFIVLFVKLILSAVAEFLLG